MCFVGVKESDDEEEENNTSPVKRPASLMSGKKPALVVSSVCSCVLMFLRLVVTCYFLKGFSNELMTCFIVEKTKDGF